MVMKKSVFWNIMLLMLTFNELHNIISQKTELFKCNVLPFLSVYGINIKQFLCEVFEKTMNCCSGLCERHKTFAHSFIYQWRTALCCALPSSSVRDLFHTQTVELLGRVINPSQDRYRTTQTQNKRAYKHPFLEWDSNPRSQRSNE
jgi:hypothetical protein